jgi:hypothetical protein
MRMRVPKILLKITATKMRVTKATLPSLRLFRTRLHAYVEHNVNLTTVGPNRRRLLCNSKIGNVSFSL